MTKQKEDLLDSWKTQKAAEKTTLDKRLDYKSAAESYDADLADFLKEISDGIQASVPVNTDGDDVQLDPFVAKAVVVAGFELRRNVVVVLVAEDGILKIYPPSDGKGGRSGWAAVSADEIAAVFLAWSCVQGDIREGFTKISLCNRARGWSKDCKYSPGTKYFAELLRFYQEAVAAAMQTWGAL